LKIRAVFCGKGKICANKIITCFPGLIKARRDLADEPHAGSGLMFFCARAPSADALDQNALTAKHSGDMMILSAQMRRSRILQKCPGKAALCAAFAVTSH
jgi:hypothetical protein